MIPLQPTSGALNYAPELVNFPFANYINRTALGIMFLMLLSFQSYGQDDWTLHSEVDGVKAYYKISSCNNESLVFLKFINSNSAPVKVSWKEEFRFDDESEFVRISALPTELELEQGQVSGTTCVDTPIIQLVSRPNLNTAEDIPATGVYQESKPEPKQVMAFRLVELHVKTN